MCPVTSRSPITTVINRRLTRGRVGRGWLWAEGLACAAGLAALAVWALAGVSGLWGTRQELQRFAALQAAARASASSPDQRLWSPKRVRAWRDTLEQASPAPLAVLRIRRIGLEVPVLEGTDEWTLNRAAGHIAETAAPGTLGNSGIAGHRDGFFRVLKDVRSGDILEIETLRGVDQYRVERTWVVEPKDVSVLDPTSSPAVTLVTCYPFYFVGPAPQRFIVRAIRTKATT
jgi:sortase A